MYLELGEVFVEEILKEKRLGSKGFAWIRVSLQLGHSFGVHWWLCSGGDRISDRSNLSYLFSR